MFKALQITAAMTVLALSTGLGLAQRGAAHETGAPHEETQATQGTASTNKDWEYTAPKGSSLTLLVRRSLQLYDEANNSISLSQAGVIFAETNIVKQLGARLLKIGEQVKIDSALVSDYAQKSLALSQTQQKAWDKYVRRANFDLGYIKPIVSPGAASDAQTNQPAQPSPSPDQNGQNNKNQSQVSKNWQWWLVALSAVSILYYLIRSERR